MNSFSQISNYWRKLMRYGRYFSFLNITILFLKLFKFTQNNMKTYFYRTICHRNKLLKYFFVVDARIHGFITLRTLRCKIGEDPIINVPYTGSDRPLFTRVLTSQENQWNKLSIVLLYIILYISYVYTLWGIMYIFI